MGLTRREFLAMAGVAAAGVACGAGPGTPKREAAATKPVPRDRTLRIIQWNHFIPSYDDWFDNEYTKRWGEEHGYRVVVDHIPLTELPARAAAEVAAQRGHDLIAFTSPPPALEDHVIDHREVVDEVTAKLGPMAALCERSVRNARTGRYFGFSNYWVANAVHYRDDLWQQAGVGPRPDSWDDVLRAGPALKAMGHPLGLGMAGEIDYDSTYTLTALMHAHGASVQDEEGNVVINRPATVEAVKLGAAIFRSGMTDDVFAWDAASNNRYLASGKGSLILNGISALRAVEDQDPSLASSILLAPPPVGPSQRIGQGIYVTNVFAVWKFAEHREAASQFLVDLALSSREAFVRSGYYNLPAFEGAVPDLADLVAADSRAEPPGKYRLLADATSWSTNIGHPGHANAGVDEVFNQFIVPQMFAAAAKGEMTPEESVAAAERRVKPIFDKWRERGKI